MVAGGADAQTSRQIADTSFTARAMIIYHHPRFKKSYYGLDEQIKAQAEKSVALFRSDPFNVCLDTHRLHGKLKKQWSFSVNIRHRILFEFLNKAQTEVVFLDIGDHRIYR